MTSRATRNTKMSSDPQGSRFAEAPLSKARTCVSEHWAMRFVTFAEKASFDEPSLTYCKLSSISHSQIGSTNTYPTAKNSDQFLRMHRGRSEYCGQLRRGLHHTRRCHTNASHLTSQMFGPDIASHKFTFVQTSE